MGKKGGKKGKKGKKGKAPAGPSPLLLPEDVRSAAANGDLAKVTAWLDGGGAVNAMHDSPAPSSGTLRRQRQGRESRYFNND